MNLSEFLTARIAEDEAWAKAAAQLCGGDHWRLQDIEALSSRRLPRGFAIHPGHVARHDPARVLAKCEATRLLVSDLTAEKHGVVEDCWYTCAAATEERDGGETCDDARRDGPCDCGRDARIERRLRLLALPYADHPDYDPDWRP